MSRTILHHARPTYLARADRLLSNVSVLITERRFDVVCASGLILLVAIMILRWHVASQTILVPFHDGSHHVANVDNLAGGIRSSGPQALLAYTERTPSDAAMYSPFLLAALAAGNGRFAFGLVWVGCLILITAALAGYFHAMRGPALTVALALLLFSGLFQTRNGGALDTRVDLLAASVGLLALLLFVRGHFFAAALTALVAGFAK